MKSLLRRFLDFLNKLLFGEDIFISYAREDGSKYARELFVKLTEQKNRFTCYMDELGTEPGKEIPPSLRRKVRSCSMLVLVGSPCAATSEGVRDEIIEFLSVKRNRERIIPIDVKRAIRKSIWAEMVFGIDVEDETKADALDGNVADSVIERIERAGGYRKQTDRLRLARNCMLTVLASLLLLSVGAAVFAYQRMALARNADARARVAMDDASAADAKANKATKDANTAVAAAQQKINDANNQAVGAEARRAEAETKMQEAETKRDQAEEDIKRQEAIAEARRLANRSAELVNSDIVKSVDYAAQSVQKAESRAVQLYDASQALRDSLWLLPRQGELRDVPGDKSVLSAGGKYVAVATTDDTNFTRTLIQVFQADELNNPLSVDPSAIKPKHQFSFDTDEGGSISQFAISADSRRAAAVEENNNNFVFVVKDLEGRVVLDSRTFPSYQQDLTIRSIALSPDGDFLALAVNDPKETKPSEGFFLPKTIDSILLVDLAKKVVSRVCSMQDTDLRSLSFAEGGKSLIGVGGSTRGEGMSAFITGLYRVSNVLLWKFRGGSPAKSMEGDPIDPDLYPFEYAKNAAISDDGTLLAVTQGLGTVTIYELENQRLVARFPSSAFSEQLRFSNDGRTLVTLFGGTYVTWDVKGYTAQSESVDWNADLAKRFEPRGQKFFAVQQNGVISSVTESSSGRVFPLAPELLLAPRLPNDAELEDQDQFNFDRTLDPFMFALTPDGNMLAALVDNPGPGFQIQLYQRKLDRYVPHASSPPGIARVSRVFQTPSLPGFQRNEDPYRQIAISPNGKYVACNCAPGKSPAVADSKQALCIWDVDRVRWLNKRIEKLSSPIRFKFSPRGKYLAVFGSGQDLVLFNVQNNSEHRFSSTNSTYFDELSFDSEERLIGAATGDTEVEVLNTRDLSRVAHLPLRKKIGELAFSLDGKALLTHSYKERVTNSERWEVWDLDDNRLVSETCSRLSSSFFVVESQIQACKSLSRH